MPPDPLQHLATVVGSVVAIVTLAALLLALLGGWIDARRGWPSAGAGAAAILLVTAAAGLAAYRPLFDEGPASELSSRVEQRLLWAGAALAVVLVAVGWAIRRLRQWMAALAWITLAAVAVAAVLLWAFLPIPVPDGSTRAAFCIHQLGPALLAALVMWAMTETLSRRSPGMAAPMVAGLVAIATGSLLLTMPSIEPALLALVAGTSAGGAVLAAWVAALLRKKVSISIAVAGGPLLLWFALLAGMTASECIGNDLPPPRSLAWLLAAPLLAWVPEIGPMRRWRPWQRQLLRTALVAIPVAIVTIPALLQVKQDASDA